MDGSYRRSFSLPLPPPLTFLALSCSTPPSAGGVFFFFEDLPLRREPPPVRVPPPAPVELCFWWGMGIRTVKFFNNSGLGILSQCSLLGAIELQNDSKDTVKDNSLWQTVRWDDHVQDIVD